MPRIGRAVLPDHPHHIIQRGHNRHVVFVEAGDVERYVDTLADFRDIHGVKVCDRNKVTGQDAIFSLAEFQRPVVAGL